MLLTTIAFETSYAADMPPDTPDPLAPLPSAPPTPTPFTSEQSLKCADPAPPESSCIIDLRFSIILDRLRNPPPPPPPRSTSPDNLLPLPNTTSLQLPTGLRMFLRARQQLAERARTAEATVARTRTEQSPRSQRDDDDNTDGERQRIPGGLASADGT